LAQQIGRKDARERPRIQFGKIQIGNGDGLSRSNAGLPEGNAGMQKQKKQRTRPDDHIHSIQAHTTIALSPGLNGQASSGKLLLGVIDPGSSRHLSVELVPGGAIHVDRCSTFGAGFTFAPREGASRKETHKSVPFGLDWVEKYSLEV
jgi:hypothetical protein